MLTTKPIAIGARVVVTNASRQDRGRVAGYATVEDQPSTMQTWFETTPPAPRPSTCPASAAARCTA